MIRTPDLSIDDLELLALIQSENRQSIHVLIIFKSHNGQRRGYRIVIQSNEDFRK